MKKTVFYDFYQKETQTLEYMYEYRDYGDVCTTSRETEIENKTLLFSVDRDCINQFISEVILGIPYQEIDALRRMQDIPGIDDLDRVNAMKYYDQQMLEGHLSTVAKWISANFAYSLEIYTREVYTND